MNQPPDTEFELRVAGFDSGLTGQIGVRIFDNGGNEVLPRTTNGVNEYPQDSGSYVTTLISPHDPGDYSIMWDINDVITPGTVAFEDLIVVGGYTTSEVLPGEILATLGDINANLPADNEVPVVVATVENTALLQVSVARVVRGYLSRVIENSTLLSWTNPALTPELVREAAAKLIAAQLYFNKNAESSTTIEDDSFAQKRYDEAMAILNGIIGGTLIIPDIIATATEGMVLEDGWPIDDTDRSFTMSQQF